MAADRALSYSPRSALNIQLEPVPASPDRSPLPGPKRHGNLGEPQLPLANGGDDGQDTRHGLCDRRGRGFRICPESACMGMRAPLIPMRRWLS